MDHEVYCEDLLQGRKPLTKRCWSQSMDVESVELAALGDWCTMASIFNRSCCKRAKSAWGVFASNSRTNQPTEVMLAERESNGKTPTELHGCGVTSQAFPCVQMIR